MAFDQTVLLEPTQRLGEDLARDAADESGELAVPARVTPLPPISFLVNLAKYLSWIFCKHG
jgi:hypothetical protein